MVASLLNSTNFREQMFNNVLMASEFIICIIDFKTLNVFTFIIGIFALSLRLFLFDGQSSIIFDHNGEFCYFVRFTKPFFLISLKTKFFEIHKTGQNQ